MQKKTLIMSRKSIKEMTPKKELAKEYFLQGLLYKDIAEKVGVSERTIQNWIKQNNWVAVASAKSISREEIVSKLLNQIHDKVASGSWSPDQIVKAANAVKALDKENGITTIIDVFTQFSHWLEEKIKTSPNLNISDLKTFQSLMDEYVSEIAAKLPK